jgi:hypothetical protein
MPKMQRAESEKSSDSWESRYDEMTQGSSPKLNYIAPPALHRCNVIDDNLAKPHPRIEPSVGAREIYLEISIS